MKRIHLNILVQPRDRKDFGSKKLKINIWGRLRFRYNRERHWKLCGGECKENLEENTNDKRDKI